MKQQILGGVSEGFCLRHIWIVEDARFRQCFIPVVAAVPTAIAALILLGQILKLACTSLGYKRPRWTRRFVEEIVEPTLEPELGATRKWTKATISLLTLSIFGALVQLVATISALMNTSTNLSAPGVRTSALETLPWIIIVLEICIFRPTRVPFAVLTILTVNLVAQSIMLEKAVAMNGPMPFLAAGVTINAISIIVLSGMPFRDSVLPSKEISKPFAAPTSALRSPEENLNIWQFMTVTWITPMLNIGGKRQMEDADVWSLPYEFQHARLHENFRVLRGTVITRLLTANGIDLVITTILGFLEKILDYAAPFFLQLILSSMEDPERPKRVALIYAGLSLVARLMSAQVDVVQLWYGRRAYERSRGQMITMLYEKTLGRKMAFRPAEKIEPVQENGTLNGHINDEVTPIPRANWWINLMRPLRSLLQKSQAAMPVKEPASMGRILNLMRNDVYEVAQRFWEFDKLIKKPAAIILSIWLVVNYLGWASMMAVGLVFFAQIMNAILARILTHFEKKRRFATDAKLQIVSQFVEAIRHLRWYGWQDTW